jgi:DNA polymerase-3 subunit delta
MSSNPPVIYILHGEDELKIAQTIAELKAKLGDPVMAELNTIRLDARTASFDELVTATSAMPFMASRRLVVVSHPLARYSAQAEREKFIRLLESIPRTTALILVENRPLTDEQTSKKGGTNWLEKWAREAGERVYLRLFTAPKGQALVGWINQRARELGGQFSPEASALLGSIVGDDLRVADQEVRKLLTYVNFERQVEEEDVLQATPFASEGDIFALFDSLGNQNGQQAFRMFHRLLAGEDAKNIFYRLVNQFRTLLLAREILENGGDEIQIREQLKIHPYAAQKIYAQANRFELATLELAYRRLLEIDVAEKSGEMDADLNLDAFIAEFTAS